MLIKKIVSVIANILLVLTSKLVITHLSVVSVIANIVLTDFLSNYLSLYYSKQSLTTIVITYQKINNGMLTPTVFRYVSYICLKRRDTCLWFRYVPYIRLKYETQSSFLRNYFKMSTKLFQNEYVRYVSSDRVSNLGYGS